MPLLPVVEWRPGGFWWRFLALFIDIIILSVVNAVLFGVDGGIPTAGHPQDRQPAIAALEGVGCFLVSWLYFALSTASPWCATPGKKLLGMVVVDRNGRRISFARATARHFASFLSTLLFGLGYLMVAWSVSKRSLHDRIAGTQVMRRIETGAQHEQVVPPGAIR